MEWCLVCCSQHLPGRACPGELLASGPERQARRFQVSQARRIEYYGVLIAESDDLWRSRIFTYPNMLWSVPGGRGTMKFVGSTAQEVEAKAVAFIREHCKLRKFLLTEHEQPKVAGRMKRERAAVQNPRSAREERHPSALNVLFGEEQAEEPGLTTDLSNGGLFIATKRLKPQGRRLRLKLQVGDYTIALRGSVAWVRTKAEKGRPIGMGIRLTQPPALYVRYVKSVEDGVGEEGEGKEG